MKKIHYIKEALLTVAFVTTIFLITSCGYSQKPNDTKDVAEKQNEEKFDNNKQGNDSHFLVNAAEINLGQIQLGQLAQQKGRTAEVKEYGKMIEDAHTKSLNELTALAISKMISIPTSPTDNARDAYKDLNEKEGNDFDKAYADIMVGEHKDAIEVFEDASTNRNDSDIKNWATASLLNLRNHLNNSTHLQNNLKANNSRNN